MPADPHREFRLYNTATRSIDPVRTIEPGLLRLYACGPTVYTYAHIGNFRTFLTSDLIVRTARAIGWETAFVCNVTDVGHLTEDDAADLEGEDKMERALYSQEGNRFSNVWDLARHYTEAFVRDWKTLNLLIPDVWPRASQHMREQILAIEKLVEDGHAYETEDAVYFSVPSFPAYGRLSGNTEAANLEQAVREVVVDDQKQDPRDFALWKKDEKHLMQWHSPWGWGFPGWHLECSVMAMQYLGDELDIHAGGEDLIFPHHECEIAQSESISGKRFARHWVHSRFLQLEGGTMSKSKGNVVMPDDLVRPGAEGGKEIDPLAVRYALISGYYRKPFNFTFKNLDDSAKIVQRYREVEEKVQARLVEPADDGTELGEELDRVYENTLAAMLDDLNTPIALASALEGVKILEAVDELGTGDARRARMWLDQINDLLGIVSNQVGLERPAIPASASSKIDESRVEALIAERRAARAEKDWARADAVRDELQQMGVELKDTPEGTTWSLRKD